MKYIKYIFYNIVPLSLISGAIILALNGIGDGGLLIALAALHGTVIPKVSNHE